MGGSKSDKRQIFLASSSELVDDRREFEIFINRQNKRWHERGLFLELVVWEDFVDAMSRTRLQDEYNRAIRSCDLFVMLFWRKVGMYTAEEFETAFLQFKATGRPKIYTYFKIAPVSMAGTNRREMNSLWDFQDKLKELGHFQTEYDSTNDLHCHFGEQLEKLALGRFFGNAPGPETSASFAANASSYRAQLQGSGAIAQGPGALAVGAGGVFVGAANTGVVSTVTKQISGGAVFEAPVQAGAMAGRDLLYIGQVVRQVLPDATKQKDAQAVVAQYLDGLVAELTGLRLHNVDENVDIQQTALELREIYVPLDTEAQIPSNLTLARLYDLDKIGGSVALSVRMLAKETRPVSALEALAHHPQLTLLGRAGSGKSTFGEWVLLTLAQGWRGKVDLQAELGETWTHGRLLPIRIVLREFAAGLALGHSSCNAGHLWAHVASNLGGRYCDETQTLQYLQRVARDHGALFILDGLDECGGQRDQVNQAIEDLMRHWGGKCRFLRTARPSAWPQGAVPEKGVYALAPLSHVKIATFIHRWYAAVRQRGWPLRRPVEQMVGDLARACEQRDIQPLASNPLLLTLMSLIHTTRARLPDDRAELYGSAVDLLLQRWNDADQREGSRGLCQLLGVSEFPLDNVKEVLAKVAFEVHSEQAPYIGEDRLKRAFRRLTQQSDDKARLLIDYIEGRAGLLICDQPRGADVQQERLFSFPHRTFQEFLAALYLAKFHDEPSTKARELAEGTLSQWEVVLPLMARIAGPTHGASHADALIGRRDVQQQRCRSSQLTRVDWQRALLAGLQLLEIGPDKVAASEDRAAILERVTGWLVELLAVPQQQGGLDAVLRARAGNVLSLLGDARFDAERFHLPKAADLGFVAIPDQPDLRFARYLTTVAQYRSYLAATCREPGDPKTLCDPDQRPARWVNKFDAQAYCTWLNGAGILAAGWRAALPTEAEWEHASRGGQPAEWMFCWGNDPDPDRANYCDSGVGDATTVGCFAANGFGLHDMLGNVFEWTESPWSIADGNPVVRGGAFYDASDHARCAYRLRLLPDFRFHGLGFRVVLRRSPV